MVVSVPRSTLGTTASMQADPEARHILCGAASESISGRLGPACAGSAPDLWVPAVERAVVPEQLASVCAACPEVVVCLQRAVRGAEVGYWAGTTSSDRAAMLAAGQVSVAFGRQLQARARAARCAGPVLHEVGQGSARWYRRGCRCQECRAVHAACRAQERARARQRRMMANVA